MGNFNSDIFLQAQAEVEDKSIGSRIWHSGALHSLRSAVGSKGSAASKGLSVLKSVGQSALSLVPIPIVGNLASAIVEKIDGELRGRAHNDKLKKAIKEKNKADEAKFTIKELSVEELDRYRWKVDEEYKELEKIVRDFNSKKYEDRMCDDYYVVAYQIAQTRRRVEKLKGKLDEINAATAVVKEWLDQVETGVKNPVDGMKPAGGVLGLQNAVAKELGDKTSLWTMAFQADEVVPMHAGCTNWCCVKETARHNPNMGVWRDRATKVGHALTFAASIAYEEYGNFDSVET